MCSYVTGNSSSVTWENMFSVYMWILPKKKKKRSCVCVWMWILPKKKKDRVYAFSKKFTFHDYRVNILVQLKLNSIIVRE